MFNWEKPIVTNAKIQFGDTDVSGKGRHFKSRFIQPGVAGYPGQFGNVLITKENLDKFIDTMVGVPVRIKHGDNTTNDDRVGVVNSVWFDDKDGWYWCDGIIWDETAINLIKDKGWNVSCAYKIKEADNAGGTENNISYDMEFLDGVFDHLAIVDNPRYERAQIVLNAKELIENDNTSFFVIYNDSDQDLSDTSTDRWITIHPNGEDAKGRPVLIPEGKTVSEVMKEKYAKWATERKDQQKLFDPKQYKTGISDYKLEKKTDEAVKKYGEFADREQIKEHLKEKHNYKDYLKKDTKEEKPTSLKKNETSEDFKKRILSTEVTKYKPTTYTIDYGNSTRGQGKRVKGQVKGSMFDLSLQGKKEYKRLLGGLPEYEEIKDEFGSSLDGERMKVAYLKAREAGFNKEQSLRFAYTLDEPENLLYKQLKQAHNSKDVEDFKQAFYEALEEVMIKNALGELVENVRFRTKYDKEGEPYVFPIEDSEDVDSQKPSYDKKTNNKYEKEKQKKINIEKDLKELRKKIQEEYEKITEKVNKITDQLAQKHSKDIGDIREFYKIRETFKNKFREESGYNKLLDQQNKLIEEYNKAFLDLNKKIAKDNIKPLTIADVKNTGPMTQEEANGGKVNPKYNKNTDYGINCQSCVVCYEARLRGYNVKTLPNTPGSKLRELEKKSREAWINPKTGEYAIPIPEGKDVKNPKECYQFLMNNVEEGKRYNLGMNWAGHTRDGHVVTIYKENGDLILYDPQSGEKFKNKAMGKDYLNKIKYKTSSYGTKYNLGVDLYRVDNLAFNPEYMNDIMKGY